MLKKGNRFQMRENRSVEVMIGISKKKTKRTNNINSLFLRLVGECYTSFWTNYCTQKVLNQSKHNCLHFCSQIKAKGWLLFKSASTFKIFWGRHLIGVSVHTMITKLPTFLTRKISRGVFFLTNLGTNLNCAWASVVLPKIPIVTERKKKENRRIIN